MESSKEFIGTFGAFDYHVILVRDGSKYVSFQLIKTDARESNRICCKKGIPSSSTLIILDSVKSGTGRNKDNDIYSIVMAPILRELSWNHTYVRTSTRDSVRELAKSLDPSQSYEIWIISGDTTISEFINHVPNGGVVRRMPLTILPVPMGTGNAWANSIGFHSPVAVLGNYFSNTLRPMDISLYRAILPNGYSIIFFIIFSMGFHANLLHACEDPKYANMGSERFQIAARKILENYDLSLSITVEGSLNSYSYFALMNTPNLEANYRPSPLSDPLEKELRLLGYSSALDRDKLVQKIMRGYQNKPHENLPTDEDTIYKSITHDFTMVLNDPLENSSVHEFEICCDGVLLNLLDYKSVDKNKPSNEIRFQFLNDYSDFQLQVYSP